MKIAIAASAEEDRFDNIKTIGDLKDRLTDLQSYVKDIDRFIRRHDITVIQKDYASSRLNIILQAIDKLLEGKYDEEKYT